MRFEKREARRKKRDELGKDSDRALRIMKNEPWAMVRGFFIGLEWTQGGWV
jgi:hypothetical protein